MALLRKANEVSQTDWHPMPEGLWRWRIGKPELRYSERYSNYQVRFVLRLAQAEVARLLADFDDPPPGAQQSTQVWYSVGLSLGWVDKKGQYQTTKLVDFLAACFGAGGNGKKFREWIEAGFIVFGRVRSRAKQPCAQR